MANILGIVRPLRFRWQIATEVAAENEWLTRCRRTRFSRDRRMAGPTCVARPRGRGNRAKSRTCAAAADFLGDNSLCTDFIQHLHLPVRSVINITQSTQSSFPFIFALFLYIALYARLCWHSVILGSENLRAPVALQHGGRLVSSTPRFVQASMQQLLAQPPIDVRPVSTRSLLTEQQAF